MIRPSLLRAGRGLQEFAQQSCSCRTLLSSFPTSTEECCSNRSSSPFQPGFAGACPVRHASSWWQPWSWTSIQNSAAHSAIGEDFVLVDNQGVNALSTSGANTGCAQNIYEVCKCVIRKGAPRGLHTVFYSRNAV